MIARAKQPDVEPGLPSDLSARVSEYELFAFEQMESDQIAEWAKRIKNQLNDVQLGRKKEADETGLKALETLASCPVVSDKTRKQIKNLVAAVRSEKLEKIELKRKIELVTVEIDTAPLRVGRNVKVEAVVA